MKQNKFFIKAGNLFFKYRNLLFPLFIITLFLFTRPALFLNSPGLDKIAVTLGILTALTGQAIRFIVIGFAYIKRGGRDGKVYADELVTEGIYNHVRNPMYLGNFLILTGIGIIYGSLYIYLIVIPFFSFIYLSIVLTEENYLKGHFGQEYEEYCKRTPRFLIKLKGIKKNMKQFNYNWRKAIRKDYGTFFGTIVGCYATFLWKKYYLTGFPKSRQELIIPVSIFFLIALGYGITRYLKKSGRLRLRAE